MRFIARTLAVAVALAPAIALAHDNDKKDDKSASMKPGDTTKSATAAQTETTGSTTRSDSMKADDKLTDAQIASMLHKVNKAEIDAGKLAERQGHSSGIKDYGRMLVKDHQDADSKLMKLAKAAKLDLDDLTSTQKEKLQVDDRKMDQVKKMKGAEFDKAFADVMYNGHDDVLKMLSDHGKDIQADSLKQFADEVKPKLEHHKDMANQLKSASSAAADKPQGRSGDMNHRSMDTSQSNRSGTNPQDGTGDNSTRAGAPDKDAPH